MSESDIVRMSISLANAATPAVANLNTPLLAGYHTHYVDRVRQYATSSVLTQMVTDGFSVNEALYKAASRIASLPNAPGNIAIGRRVNKPLQSVNLACVDGTVGDAYQLTLVGSDGVVHQLAYTNVANPGPAIAGTALSGTATATQGSATVTFTAGQTLAAGSLLTFSNQTGASYQVLAATSSSTTATLTTVFTGATASGLTATPGATTAVTNGSTAVTFSQAQTIAAGALLTFSSQPGVYYEVATAVASSTSGTLTVAYAGTTAAAAQTQVLAPLAGTFGVVNGSASVATTASQVGVVYPGDSVQFPGAVGGFTAAQANVSYTALTVTASTLTLTQPYTGLTNATTKGAIVCTSATAATALAAVMGALSNIGTVSVIASVAPSPNLGLSATVQLSRVDGSLTDVQNWASNGFQSIQLTNVTADPGITADLAAMLAYSANWYGLVLDSNGALEIEAAAAWAEATGAGGKVFFWDSSDYGNTLTSVTTDVFSTLKALTYQRDFGQQNDTQLLSYAGASICGNVLARNPGSYTLAFQSEPGVPADAPQTLSESQQLALNTMTAANPGTGGKNGNWYANVAGLNILFPGVAPSGRFFDVTLFIDWLQVTIQQRVFAVLTGAASAPGKVPYTNIGLGLLGDAIQSVLRLGSTPAYGGIVPDGADPTRPIRVTVADVSTISSIDRANRNVPASAISWSAGLTGAAETVTVQGTLVQ